jgi:DNA-binding response OmpR family regulator
VVVERGDAADLAGLVAREQPALIILDVMLPGLDGLNACRRSAWRALMCRC